MLLRSFQSTRILMPTHANHPSLLPSYPPPSLALMTFVNCLSVVTFFSIVIYHFITVSPGKDLE